MNFWKKVFWKKSEIKEGKFFIGEEEVSCSVYCEHLEVMNSLGMKFAIFLVAFFIVISFLGEFYGNSKASKAKEEGYIDACKDFYAGSLKASLVENKDGTANWVLKK